MPKGAFLLVTVGNILIAAVQWYIVWLFARQNGAHAVGQYSALLAFLTPIFISGQLGLRNLYISLQRRVRWNVYLALRVSTVVLSAIVALTIIRCVGDLFDWRLASGVLVIKISDSLADLFFARLQKAERLTAFGVLLISNACITATVVTGIVLASESVIAGVWGAAATAALAAGATAVLGLRRSPAPSSVADPQALDDGTASRVRTVEDVWALLRAGVPLSLMQGIYSLLSYVPLGIVGMFGTSGDVGRYASAAYLVVFANLVGASVETVVLPGYRRRFHLEGRRILLNSVTARSAVTFIALSPLVVLAVITGPDLLAAVYGPEFAVSRTAVLFLALAACLTMPTYMLSATLLVLNRYWATTSIGAVSVLFVFGSGFLAGSLGMEAVNAGCIAVLIGSLARYCGELLLCHLPVTRTAGTDQELKMSKVSK